MKYLTEVVIVLVVICVCYYYIQLGAPKKKESLMATSAQSIDSKEKSEYNCTPDHDQQVAESSLSQIANYIIKQKTFYIHVEGKVYTYKLESQRKGK